MKSNLLLRRLWLLLALTFPLFAVQFFRYNNATLQTHIAAPMLVLGAIIGVAAILQTNQGIPRLRHPQTTARRRAKRVLILGYLFVLAHCLGLFLSHNSALASRELYKIVLGLVCFNVIVGLFPRDEQFMARFWTVVVWSSTILIAYLFYKSAVVFDAPYLVSELVENSRAAKNQLAGFMVYVFPFAVGYASLASHGLRRWLRWTPAMVLATGLLYNGSRGGWVATLAGLLAAGFLVGRTYGFRRLLMVAWVVSIATLVGYLTLEGSVKVARLDYYNRVVYFYDPDSVPEFDTWNQRTQRAMNTLRTFATSPIVGVGLGNTGDAIGTLPHNDYLLVLSDLGLVGALLFGGILVIMLKSLKMVRDLNSAVWLQSAWRAGFVGELVFMLTMDRIYSTTLFWAFIGLSLVTAELEGQPATEAAAALQQRAPLVARRLILQPTAFRRKLDQPPQP